ncbi:hypothetical protein [Flexibacterium corallicola]|nr:hypothetical protein [Pseudovibrio sp. M1P-2-3]
MAAKKNKSAGTVPTLESGKRTTCKGGGELKHFPERFLTGF